MNSPFLYFYDPILRAPTIGCMLMCLSAALVGVIAFLKKQSLLGESLSHASFPGVILGVMAAGAVTGSDDHWLKVPLLTMAGAFASALAGLWLIHFIERKAKIRSDSALCFVLSIFFGIGLTLASQIQFTQTALYKQGLNYLYGQAATMTDVHIVIYGALSLVIILMVLLNYKELQAITFDREYAKSIGIKVRLIDNLILFLIALAIVVGIRSVGVVLMSAMLIAPAVAARQFTHRLSLMLFWAAVFGLASGYLGNYISVEASRYLTALNPSQRQSLPTGPTIVMVATSICLIALFFAPERGWIVRMVRVTHFRYRCLSENLLKALWRFGPGEEHSFAKIVRFQEGAGIYLRFVLHRLCSQGWVKKVGKGGFCLTQDGKTRAEHIVRLHRLWEVYLADYLGVGAERVHKSAEEMEHIITPELEAELTQLLKDPKYDPHHQPIPPHQG